MNSWGSNWHLVCWNSSKKTKYVFPYMIVPRCWHGVNTLNLHPKGLLVLSSHWRVYWCHVGPNANKKVLNYFIRYSRHIARSIFTRIFLIGTHNLPPFSLSTSSFLVLTHWGRVTHICVSELTIIGSDNDLSPGRRQAIIWTNGGILLIRRDP